jgi:hypothetical protein
MKIHWKDSVVENIATNPRVDSTVTQAIKKEIEDSFNIGLETPFIVNDTKWFKYIGKKMKPRVTNSAEYISKKFQQELQRHGWETDKTIENQEIDGYKEFSFDIVRSDTITSEHLQKILSQIPFDDNFVSIVRTLFKCNFKSEKFLRPPLFYDFPFDKKEGPQVFRAGLEFETGNIASSFRAFSKLNYLFDKNKIDLGIFISSVDKSVSTRIWPAVNRNGSLEELENRNYALEFRLPVLIAGFEPDIWDNNAHYFDRDNRYEIHTGGHKDLVLSNGKRKRMISSRDGKLYKEP